MEVDAVRAGNVEVVEVADAGAACPGAVVLLSMSAADMAAHSSAAGWVTQDVAGRTAGRRRHCFVVEEAAREETVVVAKVGGVGDVVVGEGRSVEASSTGVWGDLQLRGLQT